MHRLINATVLLNEENTVEAVFIAVPNSYDGPDLVFSPNGQPMRQVYGAPSVNPYVQVGDMPYWMVADWVE